MNDTPPQPDSWTLRHWKWLLAILLIAAVILPPVWFAEAGRLHEQAVIQNIRKSGDPVTLAELDAWYQFAPSNDDAALMTGQAFTLIAPHGNDIGNWFNQNRRHPIETPPLSPELNRALQEYLRQNQPALKILREAAAMKHARYSVNMNAGFGTLLPHLAKLRQSSNLLLLDALAAADAGDLDHAIESIITGLRLADSLAFEPIIVSQNVRYVCATDSAGTLERILQSHALTDRQLSELSAAFAAAEHPEALARTLAGERCMDIDFFTLPAKKVLDEASSLSDQTLPKPTALLGFSALQNLGVVTRDRSYCLDALNDFVAAARLPYPERYRNLAAITNRVGNTLSHGNYFFSPLLLSRLGREALREARAIALLRAARVSLAVERYRLNHQNSLPADLSPVIPEFKDLPADPYDGQPLRYRKLPKGFVIYTIGEDGIDHGGAESTPIVSGPEGRQTPPVDATFIVER